MAGDHGKLAVITGGNRGIGLAIAKGLGKKFRGNSIVVTARQEGDGQQAVEDLTKEEGGVTYSYQVVDITDAKSVKGLADRIKKEYDGLDVLINNAGFAFKHSAKEPFGEQAKTTVDINYFGTQCVCETLVPLLRPGARVVVVSSSEGWIAKKMSDSDTKEKLCSDSLTTAELDKIMEEFVEAAKKGKHEELGWPDSASRSPRSASAPTRESCSGSWTRTSTTRWPTTCTRATSRRA